MSTFRLQFDPSLRSVMPMRGTVTVGEVPTSPAASRNYEADALRTLNALGKKIAHLENDFHRQFAQMKESLVKLAVDVARGVLSEDPELVQQRVRRFVEIACEEMQPVVPDTVYVHPECVAAIVQWKTGCDPLNFDVQPDATLAPGDCRIERDNKGMVATLDAFLHSALVRLNHDSSAGMRHA